jgi:hypothetical protein
MLFYFAGSDSAIFRDILFKAKAESILMSFFQHQGDKNDLNLEAFPNIFLDSGGFTARKRGIDISVKDYGEFILKHPEFTTYANLDVRDTKITLANQAELEAMSLHPIPVYHMDEWLEGKTELLQDYIKKYSHIAVGGTAEVQASKRLVEHFLDYIFSFTKDKVKVHGFGMTGLWLLKRYPFFSVDSTSWLSGGKYGRITKESGILNNAVQQHDNEKYPLNRVLSYQEMCKENIKTYMRVQKDITELWKNRGIDWSK